MEADQHTPSNPSRTHLSAWAAARRLRDATHRGSFALRRGPFAKGVRLVARSAVNALRPRRGDFVLSDYGVWLTRRDDDRTYVLCRDGLQGFEFSTFLRRQSSPFVLLDVGANVGLYSLIALQNPECRHVVAFEPEPETAELLRRNLSASRRTDWTVVEAAVSEMSGVATLRSRPRHSGGATLSERAARGMFDGSDQTVSLVGPADLSLILDASGEAPFVAKVDVEGHEAEAIAGLVEAVGKRLGAAWVEFSVATDTPRAEAILSGVGLKEQSRHGSPDHYDGLWLRSS